MTADDPFIFLRDAARRGQRGVLVTIVGIIGSASRAIGTHFAVAEDGRWCGSLSGGCIEAAVAAEALEVLKRGPAEVIRFGAGSRFLDIRLPCGGGLDLLFTPNPEGIDNACDLIARRLPFTIRLDPGCPVGIEEGSAAGSAGGPFAVRHHPILRIVIAGQGEEAERAVALAHAYGAEVVLCTPDSAVADRVGGLGVELHKLKAVDASEVPLTDDYTAALLLFHEHEWETALLAKLVHQPGFFIGAMGSPATHTARLAALRAQGINEAELARITGPVGLIPATRDPATLALSAVAQIVARYRDLVEGKA